jgi:hypothetical protein
MTSESWVREEEGKWSLNFPPLPEVSTILSTFVENGKIG